MFLDITGTKEYHFRTLAELLLYMHESQCFSDYDGRGDFWQDRFYGRWWILRVAHSRRDERTFIVALLACGWPNHKGYKWSGHEETYGIWIFEL